MKADFPDLHKVYQMLATSRPSTASIERVHSLFTGVMTKLRNRINKEVLCKLVFIKSNELFGTLKENYKMTDDLDQLAKEKETFDAFCEATVAFQEDEVVVDPEVQVVYPTFIEEDSDEDMLDVNDEDMAVENNFE